MKRPKKSVDPSLSLIASLMGAKGGRAKTPRKSAASRANAKKATLARLAKQQAA